jgi:general secretion pathway protein A
MYTDFYNLKERPFNITPDPRFLMYTPGHREAYDNLLYGIKERKGFMKMVGEVGSGKTTLCRAVLRSVPENVESALILNPAVNEVQLISSIMKDLGLPVVSHDRMQLIHSLNAYLLEQNSAKKNVVVMIDEAQELPPSVMEQIRLLSNLETDQDKLMQIVLIGQPELDNRLAQKEFRQLRQRIMVKCRLKPLSRSETDYYIDHRLLVAGAGDNLFFDDAAIDIVYKVSRGLPRLVNKVCDSAMLSGYAEGTHVIGRKEVKKAVIELKGIL